MSTYEIDENALTEALTPKPRRIEIEVHHAEYAPWEEGADEREKVNEWTDAHSFDNARECADWLECEGFGEPSGHPGPYNGHTWLSELDPYEHPYTGVMTERSAHAEHIHPRVWAAIVAAVSRPYTRYTGPYYVERRNALGNLI